MDHMQALEFTLIKSPLVSDTQSIDSPISGKGIVFTGKMQQGSREAMQSKARQLGARIQTAVSGTTDVLVCGEKVGAAKISKAEGLGIEILTEEEYLEIIKER